MLMMIRMAALPVFQRQPTLLVLLLVVAVSVAQTTTTTSPTPSTSSSPEEEDPSRRICTSPSNTFTVKVDMFASERGYYTLEECGDDWVNPTIGLEYGVTYTFIQRDRTNYMHPLGFGYFPDAHHVGGNMLDPAWAEDGSAIVMGDADSVTVAGKAAAVDENTCQYNMTCPAPMYQLNGANLGTYSNVPGNATVNQHETGRALYESFFFKGMAKWTGYGQFQVQLRFDNPHYKSDLFYYCRIHQFMAGRIKLLQNGVPVQPVDDPALYYDIETTEGQEFDQQCGTYGLETFQLPHAECLSKFVCLDETAPQIVQNYAKCIDAMDCHMFVSMSTKVSSRTELALFLHQMIPHHQQAVNLAKSLLHQLRLAGRECPDLTRHDDPQCVMEHILYSTVNRQNYEIGVMNNVLAAMNLPPTDDCSVMIPQQLDQSSSSSVVHKVCRAAWVGAAAAAATQWM